MDIQARKIYFIQEFLNLQSEEIISRLEEVLSIEKKKNRLNDNELVPFTMEELNERIDKSMEDSKNGRLTEANQLIAEIGKWK
ncbi:MAG: hypothetical protein K9H64_16585 [Bacteroidales bacterium]|nr:hypothetical protein [Bacteroidales bacterium]MCF8457614.1 hypothetical protein [Bacteroidales bacterium]